MTKHQWSRRQFLASASCAPVAAAFRRQTGASPSATVNTVLGSVKVEDLGVTLVHEHVLVDFIGADQVRRDRYNADEVFHVVLPHLARIRELGCRTFIDCTPAYLGRDPLLLRRLAEASGLHVITNTGYYGAAEGKYLPFQAREESAERLAAGWIDEYRRGIEGTGIKPGFIKIGVNKGPLNATDVKLVRAAALAHLETGLVIACHTGDGAAALEEAKILKREGIAPSALIWVHAQNSDPKTRANLAREGVWIEIDGVNDNTLPARIEQIKELQGSGRVLISLDAGWFNVGQPNGGAFRSYDYFFTTFVPALRKAGVSGREIRQMTIVNPAQALEPRV